MALNFGCILPRFHPSIKVLQVAKNVWNPDALFCENDEDVFYAVRIQWQLQGQNSWRIRKVAVRRNNLLLFLETFITVRTQLLRARK